MMNEISIGDLFIFDVCNVVVLDFMGFSANGAEYEEIYSGQFASISDSLKKHTYFEYACCG